jgi:hypothetical protein
MKSLLLECSLTGAGIVHFLGAVAKIVVSFVTAAAPASAAGAPSAPLLLARFEHDAANVELNRFFMAPDAAGVVGAKIRVVEAGGAAVFGSEARAIAGALNAFVEF